MSEAYDLNTLAMLPPHVAPEHRQLIDDAERALRDITITGHSKSKKKWGSMAPPLKEVAAAKRELIDNPIRQALIHYVVHAKPFS